MKVTCTRRFVKEHQNLPVAYHTTVKQIIDDLRDGTSSNICSLSGFRNFYRSRKGRIRVIWQLRPAEAQIILRHVRLRQEDTYDHIDTKPIISDIELESEVGEQLTIEQLSPENLPIYEWSGQNSWFQFIFTTWVYNPLLTAEQRGLLQVLWDYYRHQSFYALLIQSAPGTGKTVCASLIGAEAYRNQGWQVIFLLPECLLAEVNKFECIRTINDKEFFVGTLRQWLETVSPAEYEQIATDGAERLALEKLAQRQHIFEYFSLDMLKLYRAIQANDNYEKFRTVYQHHQDVVSQLKNIRLNDPNYLKGKKSWIQGLQELCQRIELESTKPLLLIIDEAQDYLLCELQSIITMARRWNNTRPVVLWLLGDINQRIQLVDFDWGALHLNKTCTLNYNYRNTTKILKFASKLHTFADNLIRKHHDRHLPQPADPKSALELGEPVCILEMTKPESALSFLELLSKHIKTKVKPSEHPQRYLTMELLGQVSLIFRDRFSIPDNLLQIKGIDYLTVEQAKGREFDACIGFCIFAGEGEAFLQEINQWYTLVTRARSRLLLLLTTAEIERLGRDTFADCEIYRIEEIDSIKLSKIANWVSELGSSEERLRDFRLLKDKILEAVTNNPPLIYWDMYETLLQAHPTVEAMDTLEEDIIQVLKNCPKSFLENELNQVRYSRNNYFISEYNHTALCYLLLLALGRSWLAFKELSPIKETHFPEYKRMVNMIAKQLETKGLVYEAERIRGQITGAFPSDYPFSQFSDKLLTDHRPLPFVLIDLVIHELQRR